ncbi:alpha/beta hydrolase [Actinomadura sp. NTSP31]|uniref:alpha/beta hydrolase n=1 Tax=Actinomadura sp. NTSP31 TaxID=1735447 RepID=UPI0035C14EC1
MSRQQREALDQMMRNGPLDIAGDPAEQRAVFERMLTARPLADDVTATPGVLGGVPVLTIEAGGASTETVLLWFHGGWYAMGSPRTSAGLSSEVARRTGARVVSVDYRLAPEHPYPAALQDARSAYQALLDGGTDPRSVVFVGESAGGGLAAATLAGLHADGLPQPACAVLFSPWTDLTLRGASMTSKAGIDPSFAPEKVRVRAADYLGAAGAAADPSVSPLFADLTGLPPLLIQAGSHEILLDDSTRLAARAAAADVAVTLDVTPGVPHLFQSFSAMLDEGDAALSRVAAFLHAHVGSPVSRAAGLQG